MAVHTNPSHRILSETSPRVTPVVPTGRQSLNGLRAALVGHQIAGRGADCSTQPIHSPPAATGWSYTVHPRRGGSRNRSDEDISRMSSGRVAPALMERLLVACNTLGAMERVSPLTTTVEEVSAFGGQVSLLERQDRDAIRWIPR
ncbi:hypothetical protein PHYPSEUDO_012701 [Phytophthora pseudosyringae]|uniref:Uncharacterized protein n=1 Tax=Phytophthora pseudosyringae TaxID=221518 RepID=A0A8T1W854_9STRA|nr:hypothetical protein PHYPSEUDO_012701 [Phytophthora pseudosyringae]